MSLYAYLGIMVVVLSASHGVRESGTHFPELLSESRGLYDQSGRAYGWRIKTDVELSHSDMSEQEQRAAPGYDREDGAGIYRFRYTLENTGEAQAIIRLKPGGWGFGGHTGSAFEVLRQNLSEALRPGQGIVIEAVSHQPPRLIVLAVDISFGGTAKDQGEALSAGKASFYIPSGGGRMTLERVERFEDVKRG